MLRFFLVIAVVVVLLVPVAALAAVKDSGVIPVVDETGNLTIPSLPQGKVVRLVIWNDEMGTTRDLGAVTSAKLNPGDGWNWEWVDVNGKRYWHLITPSSKTGANYSVDPWKNPATGRVECKYKFGK